MKKLLYTQVINVCCLFLVVSCTEDIPNASTNTEDRSGIVDTTHVVDTINIVDTVKVMDTVNVIDTLIVIDTLEVFQPEEFDASKFLGVWEEAVDTSLYYFANTTHRIEFLKNDSFNIKIDSYTDAIQQGDPCGHSWIHYAQGKVKNSDPLINQANQSYKDAVFLLNGYHTDSTYAHKMASCSGEMNFKRLFSFSLKSKDTLEMTPYYIERNGGVSRGKKINLTKGN